MIYEGHYFSMEAFTNKVTFYIDNSRTVKLMTTNNLVSAIAFAQHNMHGDNFLTRLSYFRYDQEMKDMIQESMDNGELYRAFFYAEGVLKSITYSHICGEEGISGEAKSSLRKELWSKVEYKDFEEVLKSEFDSKIISAIQTSDKFSVLYSQLQVLGEEIRTFYKDLLNQRFKELIKAYKESLNK